MPEGLGSITNKSVYSDLTNFVQRAIVIPATATFDDYLAMDLPEDHVTEEPVDPYAMDTSPGKPIKHVGFAA